MAGKKREFEFVFHTDEDSLQDELWRIAEDRLLKIWRNRKDIEGADVKVEIETPGESPKVYRASVIVNVRPEKVVASKKNDDAITALREALDAIERQVQKVRDTRKKKKG